MFTHTTQLELFMSDSKMWRDSLPCQQIKNGLSSLYKYLSTAVLATPIFVTKILCCCVTLDAMSSILLNSTNEASTYLTMCNIMRFSRTLKLVSSNLIYFTTEFSDNCVPITSIYKRKDFTEWQSKNATSHHQLLCQKYRSKT